MIANDLKEKGVSNWKLVTVCENYFKNDVNPLRDGVQVAYQKGFIRGVQKSPRPFSDSDLRFIRDALQYCQYRGEFNLDDKINTIVDKIDEILDKEDK